MKENKMTKLLNFICTMSIVFICSSAFAGEKATEVEAKTKTIMILDASGSMWGQVDGKNKIVIARDVIKDLVEDWKKENHLGLIAYGHRKKGDCQDIEQLIPVGEIDSASFIKKVAGLNPKGKTPLTASIQKAAEILKYEEESATIILVTDGLETCDSNPCAVSESLEKNGVNFTAHVVAFDLTEDEKKTLKCIADNTGGMFLSASNAGELQEALKSVAKVAAIVPPSVRLHTVMKNGSDPILEDPLYYYIYDKDGQEVQATNANEPLVHLSPGKYTVKVRHNITTIEDSFTVLEEGLLDYTIVIGTGHLKLSTTQTQNGERSSREISFNNTAITSFKLIEGDYIVRASNYAEQVDKYQKVTVTAGVDTELIVAIDKE